VGDNGGDKVADIKSFTNLDRKADVLFEVDGDEFTAVGVAPAMAILDVGAVNKAEDMDKIRIILEFLDMVLLPESAARFAARLRSSESPISIDQAAKIAVWLMEEVYAPERPTEAPSPSQNGSGSTGQSSTGGASAPASTRAV
jgi:hypothetical protein